MERKKMDILKLVAFISVFGCDLYGVKYTNLDQGKNNIYSYFIPKGWSEYRIKKSVTFLKKELVLRSEKADAENCISMGSLYKTMLNISIASPTTKTT